MMTKDEIDDLVIIEPTDFVTVGSVETGEDGEARPNERPDSRESDQPSTIDDDEDWENDEDYEQDDPSTATPETWFSWAGYLWRLLNSRIPRTGHRFYSQSWDAVQEAHREGIE